MEMIQSMIGRVVVTSYPFSYLFFVTKYLAISNLREDVFWLTVQRDHFVMVWQHGRRQEAYTVVNFSNYFSNFSVHDQGN